MTSILEKIVAIIAPHRCLECGIYNNILCSACLLQIERYEAPFCLFCNRPTPDWAPCAPCAPALQYVWPFAEYAGVIEQTIKAYKFQHVRAAAEPLAAGICLTLPYLPEDWIIVPIPTASVRVRQRGYDQALLLARGVGRQKGLVVRQALARLSSDRQVGATRQERRQQAQRMFEVCSDVRGKKILLVDDVCTTGATLSAAAELLVAAGAAEVAAAVVAWQPPAR